MVSLRVQSSANRRSHVRAPLDVPALMDFAAFWKQSRCRDVSEGGLSVELTDPEVMTAVPVGQVLEVYFELPQGIPVETLAEVVRCQSGQLALRFLTLAPEVQRSIADYCRALGRRRTRSGVAHQARHNPASNPRSSTKAQARHR